MNRKIVISISITITIVIIAFGVVQNGAIKENPPAIEESDSMNPLLEKIKQDKIKNEKSDNPYEPKEREWISSGPFSIDRSEYILGEKIFINIENLPKNVKGEMRFIKIFNSTHSQPYKVIAFDGSKIQNNFYLPIYPSMPRGFCTADSLVGEWKLIFDGTPVDSLDFKIINQIIPGSERLFKAVC